MELQRINTNEILWLTHHQRHNSMDTIGKVDERNKLDWQFSTLNIRLSREIDKRGKYVITVSKYLQQKNSMLNHKNLCGGGCCE